MLCDDHSSYCWLFEFPDTSVENTTGALTDWAAAFCVPVGLMSDSPTYFKNDTIRLVSKRRRVPHHFTLPYTPWSSGGVELLSRDLFRVFLSTTLELNMRPEKWPDLRPLVQSVLNNSPSPQRTVEFYSRAKRNALTLKTCRRSGKGVVAVCMQDGVAAVIEKCKNVVGKTRPHSGA